MLHTIEDTPNLAIHTYPSAELYGVIRNNLLALDGATRIGRAAFCGGWGHPEENVTINPFTKWKGGFRYLPGMTTLTLVIAVSNSLSGGTWQSGDSVRIYLNESLVQTSALSNTTNTITYSLGAGYSVNQAVEVRLDIYSASRPADDTQWGLYEVIEAYASPVTLADAWPGVPTFTGVYDTTKLAQLASAVDWLTRQIGRRTDPLFQAIVRAGGPYGPDGPGDPGQTNVRWYGTIVTTTTAPILRASGNVWVEGPATEEIRLFVNGSQVTKYDVSLNRGAYTWSLSYTMPQAAGTRNYVEVWYRRLTQAAFVGRSEPTNRWSMIRVWAEGAASAHAAITIPEVASRTSITWATWKAALNACATVANTIKSRIDASPSLWARQYLFRGSYAYGQFGSENEPSFEPIYIANTSRVGEAVLVRGIGNNVEWGAQTFTGKQNDIGAYELKATYSEQVTPQSRQTGMVYLDTLAGLAPGANYNVRGVPLTYAGEIWRVGTDV